MEKIQRKGFQLMETTYFDQICETGQILSKKVLLLRMSHIELAKLSVSGVLKHFPGN